MFGLDIGNLKDILTRNPLEYGDALGLTHGPLSGRAPGKLTDKGLDWQVRVTPGLHRQPAENANDIAPYIAGAIAGGSLLGGASGSGASGGSAGGGAGGASSTPAWLKFMRMGQLGSGLLGQGQPQQQMPQPMGMQQHGLLGPNINLSYPPGLLSSPSGLLSRQLTLGMGS